MKAAVITGDFDASGCYRALFPAMYMREDGHDIRLWPHTRKANPNEKALVDNLIEFDLNTVPTDLDLLVLQQKIEEVWIRLLPRKLVDCPTIFDFDDWTLGIPHWNPAHAGTDPKTGIASRENLPKIAARTDLVTVSTPFLAEKAQKWNRNVQVIRNRLHWPMWENAEPQYEVRRDRILIGWMGTFAWRSGDLDVIKQPIQEILRRNPNVDFVVSGCRMDKNPDETHDYLGVPEDRRVHVGSVSFMNNHMILHEITAVMDIGLVPLAPIGFNEAKSHLKGMEYNACGIPYIASDTESYRHYTREGENGFIAKRPRNWVSKLQTLIDDEGLRRDMGRKSLLIAKQHTMEQHWREWEDAYKSVL